MFCRFEFGQINHLLTVPPTRITPDNTGADDGVASRRRPGSLRSALLWKPVQRGDDSDQHPNVGVITTARSNTHAAQGIDDLCADEYRSPRRDIATLWDPDSASYMSDAASTTRCVTPTNIPRAVHIESAA